MAPGEEVEDVLILQVLVIKFVDRIVSVMQGSNLTVPTFHAEELAQGQESAGTCEAVHTGLQLLTRQRRCFEDQDRR